MPRALCQADPEVGQPDRQAAGWVDGQGRGWKGKHGPAGRCRTRQGRCHHHGVKVLGNWTAGTALERIPGPSSMVFF